MMHCQLFQLLTPQQQMRMQQNKSCSHYICSFRENQLLLIMLHLNGTATAGADYTASSGTITFAPGVTSQNIPVAVLADAVDEVNETVTVTLSNPSEVSLNDATGVLTITDDDAAPTLSIADLTTPNETAAARLVTVSLSAASSQTVTVNYATANGTATATNDYVLPQVH